MHWEGFSPKRWLGRHGAALLTNWNPAAGVNLPNYLPVATSKHWRSFAHPNDRFGAWRFPGEGGLHWVLRACFAGILRSCEFPLRLMFCKRCQVRRDRRVLARCRLCLPWAHNTHTPTQHTTHNMHQTPCMLLDRQGLRRTLLLCSCAGVLACRLCAFSLACWGEAAGLRALAGHSEAALLPTRWRFSTLCFHRDPWLRQTSSQRGDAVAPHTSHHDLLLPGSSVSLPSSGC